MHLKKTAGKGIFSKKEIFLAISLILAPVVQKAEASECEMLPDKQIKQQVIDCLKKNFGVVDESTHGLALKNFTGGKKSGVFVIHRSELSPQSVEKYVDPYLEEGDMVVVAQEILKNPEQFALFRDMMMKSQREAASKSFKSRQKKLEEQIFQIVPETEGLNRFEIIQLLSGQIKGRESEIQEDYAKIPEGVRKFLSPLLFGIPAQETGYKQMLVSPADAGSAWQILKSHGADQYKKIRKSFKYATMAGLRHLKKDSYRPQWKEMLRPWNFSDEVENEIIAYMTINAYNSGGGRVNQSLTEFKEKFPDEESLKKIHKNSPITALDFFDNIRSIGYLKVSGYGHDSSSYASLIIQGAKVGRESYENKDQILKKFEEKISPITVLEKKDELAHSGLHVYTSHGKYDNKYNGTEVTSLVGLNLSTVEGLKSLLKNLGLEVNLIITAGTENNRKDTFNSPETQYLDGVRVTVAMKRIGIGTRYTQHTKTVRFKRHFSKMLTIGRRCRGKAKKKKCSPIRRRKSFTKWSSKKVSYKIPHQITPKTITSSGWKRLKSGGAKLWEALKENPKAELLKEGSIGKIIKVENFIYEVRKRGGDLDIAVYTPDFYEKNKEKIERNIMGISELAENLLANKTSETQENSDFIDVSTIISQYANLSDQEKPFVINKNISQNFLSLLIHFQRITGRKVPLENNLHTFHDPEHAQSHLQKISFDLGRKIGLKAERKRHQKLFAELAKKYGFTLYKSSKQTLAHSRKHFKFTQK